MRDNLKKYFFLILVIIFGIAGFLFFDNNLETKNANASAGKDTIAIRIIPNPERKSALDWYKSRNFKGSPQSLTVDGYNAIRDGRTVYVNAANVESGAFYTNIYLISYNQEAENLTVDIFAKILKNWQFNTNLSTANFCKKKTDVVCLTDADCELGDYCLSSKARVTRDTVRLEGLYAINQGVNNYKKKNSLYPKLGAGTYLPNKTLSVWPSWQSVLAQELEMSLPKDSINELGDCKEDRFHKITCWDEAKKEFADPSPGNAIFNLPDDSHAYVYEGAANGLSYNLCAVMESGYINANGGACENVFLNDDICIDECTVSPSTSQKRCNPDRPTMVQSCGNHDADRCNEWAIIKDCAGFGMLCSGGECIPGAGDGGGGGGGGGGGATECTTPWGAQVSNGDIATAYQSTSVPCGFTCASQTKTCNSGAWSGGLFTYTNQNCSAAACTGDCPTPWGTLVSNGGMATAYQSATVPCGSTCASQTKTCNNGTWSSGPFTYLKQTCSVGACSGDCPTPWGTLVSNGGTATAFQVTSVPCGSICASQTKTCNSGTWSGGPFTYSNQNCSVEPCAGNCITPWLTTINNGGTATAYQSATVPCGSTCISQTKTCNSGLWSGGSFTYNNQNCDVAACSCTGPFPSGSTMPYDSEESSNLTASIAWTYSDTDADGTKCQYKCSPSYFRSGNSCISTTRTFTCSSKPSVGTWWNTVPSYTQTFNGTSWTPPDDFDTDFNTTGSSISCRYTCQTNYERVGGVCVPKTYACTGTPPSSPSSIAHSSTESTGLTADTSWAYSENDTSAKCEYKCGTGYVRYNNVCELPIPKILSFKVNGAAWGAVWTVDYNNLPTNNLTICMTSKHANNCTYCGSKTIPCNDCTQITHQAPWLGSPAGECAVVAENTSTGQKDIQYNTTNCSCFNGKAQCSFRGGDNTTGCSGALWCKRGINTTYCP